MLARVSVKSRIVPELFCSFTYNAPRRTAVSWMRRNKSCFRLPSWSFSTAGLEPSSFLCFMACSSFFSCRASFRSSSLRGGETGWDSTRVRELRRIKKNTATDLNKERVTKKTNQHLIGWIFRQHLQTSVNTDVGEINPSATQCLSRILHRFKMKSQQQFGLFEIFLAS